MGPFARPGTGLALLASQARRDVAACRLALTREFKMDRVEPVVLPDVATQGHPAANSGEAAVPAAGHEEHAEAAGAQGNEQNEPQAQQEVIS
jgi:hypothetical protein